MLKSTNFSNLNPFVQKQSKVNLEKSFNNQTSYRDKNNLNISKLSENNNNSFLGTNRGNTKRSNTPITSSVAQNKSFDMKSKFKANST